VSFTCPGTRVTLIALALGFGASCSSGSKSLNPSNDGGGPLADGARPSDGGTSGHDGAAPPEGGPKSDGGTKEGGTHDAAKTETGASCDALTVPNLAALPSNGPGPDTTGYLKLNVADMAAGTAFKDTVTGVRTVKMTASGTPGTGLYFPVYSSMGLAISQAWGTSCNQYTMLFVGAEGDCYLVDYTLGGGPTNYRSGPSDTLVSASAGVMAFSRLPGNEQILYYVDNAGKVNRYDTGKNALANTGIFPIPWTKDINEWFMINAAETWATANAAGTSSKTVYALNLTTGAQITQTLPYVDDTYGGHNDVATGDGNNQVWSLASNTVTNYGAFPSGWVSQPTSHMPAMNGYWVATNTNIGGGSLPMVRIYDDGTISASVKYPRYWGQYHQSGHWWTQGSGQSQFFLMSNFETPGSGWTPEEEYALTFIDPSTGDNYRLGFSYSVYQEVSG
jgi:hypothetical protein